MIEAHHAVAFLRLAALELRSIAADTAVNCDDRLTLEARMLLMADKFVAEAQDLKAALKENAK